MATKPDERQIAADVLNFALNGDKQKGQTVLQKLEEMAHYYHIVLKPRPSKKTTIQLVADFLENKKGYIRIVPELHHSIKKKINEEKAQHTGDN